jgi:hypothetical protein
MEPYRFSRGWNVVRPALATAVLLVPAYAVAVYLYVLSPQAIDVGYAPIQPMPFSHAMHAGELGMDCRYCHNTVENTARASIPTTQTCMACHQTIRADSEKLAPLRESHETGKPIQWVRVHDLPDFVYFDHSAHVSRGVGCVSSHGRIDKMEVVRQSETLRMSWCLGCHRTPEPQLRPQEMITSMDWQAISAGADGLQLSIRSVNPSQDCSTCHR